ncbi:MAG: YlqD family protein [Caldisericum exile]
MREKLKEVDALPIDSIYPYTVIEGLVDIDVGDNLFKKIAGVEVIIKDGVVIEIKEGT